MPETIDTEAIKYQLKRTYPKKSKYTAKEWLTSPMPYIKSVREMIGRRKKKKPKKKRATLREAYDRMK